MGRPILLKLTTLALIAACVGLPAAAQADFAGRATVIDGDTIELHGQRIRLHGIDAPEASQRCTDAKGQQWRCGRQAAFALDELIHGQVLTCLGRERDRYRRVIARCSIGGIDLGEWMVRNGWATAYRRYSTDYLPAEEAARAQALGIWSGSFNSPEDWRRGN